MKIKIINLILLVLLLSNKLIAGDIKVITSDSAIYKGIHLTIMNKYDEAMEYWNNLEKKGWSESEIYFCKGVTIQSKMSELQNYTKDGQDFINIAQKCIALNEINLRKNPIDIKSWYYIGSIKCFMGLYYAENKKWISSAKYGMSAISNLERCISINSEFKEPILYIEIFKYYKYRLTKKVNFIPFLKDEREYAIEQIESVIDVGLNKFIGRNQLAWILIDYGNYEKAVRISLEGLENFPGSRFYLWAAAESYKRIGDFKNSVIYLKLIKKSLYDDGLTNEYTYAKCLLKLAECFSEMKKTAEAEKNYNEILSLNPSEDKRIHNIINSTKELILIRK